MLNTSGKISDYASLIKFRLSTLVVLTCLAGAAVAPGKLTLLQWFFLVIGTYGIVGAANALNCYLERDVDLLMARTAKRPLPQKRISLNGALIFSMVLMVVSFYVLFVYLNPKTAVLGMMGHLSYVAVYTPLKRKSMGALFSGAIPGAIPPLMGWMASQGSLSLGAWILFAILFFWQLPHFIAISLFRLKEYNAAGLKTVPGTLGDEMARSQMLLYSGVLGFVTLMPYAVGLAGNFYLLFAGLAVVLFTLVAALGSWEKGGLKWVRITFFGTLAYLPLVLGVWILDQRFFNYGS
jgi:protoheme IX farnesyltransferase